MARYIDAEALKIDLIDNRSFYPAIVANAIENAPTADVVPRSEVARLQGILLQFTDIVHKWGNKNSIDTTEISLVPILEQEADSIIAEAKQEVVREMLGEINSFIASDKGKAHIEAFGNWFEREKAKTEETIHNIGVENAKNALRDFVEELEKKYIGEVTRNDSRTGF